MEIISFSFDKETINQLEHIRKKLKYKNRSKVLRAAIDSLRREMHELDQMKGICNAVIVVVYEKHKQEDLDEFMETYENTIKTELHQHNRGICSRVLITSGNFKTVRNMVEELRKKKSVRSVTVNSY